MKNDPPGKPNHDGGDEKSTKRHVYVEPGVKIDLVDDFKKKYESAQTDNTTHSNKILFWTKVSAALLVIYVSLTAWQACLTREALHSVQRAFVSFRELAVDRISIGTNHGSRFSAIYENSGTTPAIEVVNHFGMEITPHDSEPTEQTFKGDIKDRNKVTVAPRATQVAGEASIPDIGIFGVDLGIDLSNFDAVRMATTNHFQVWGWIAYKDVFHISHVTEFCQIFREVDLNWGGNPPKPIGLHWGYDMCTHHNCVDEECSDYKEILGMSKIE